MALVERLMHLETGERNIAVHQFFAAVNEVIAGALTGAQVANYLEFSVEDQVDWDALAAQFPTGTTSTALANKALMVERIHGVFILAEGRVPGYDTPANVRTKLGI